MASVEGEGVNHFYAAALTSALPPSLPAAGGEEAGSRTVVLQTASHLATGPPWAALCLCLPLCSLTQLLGVWFPD